MGEEDISNQTLKRRASLTTEGLDGSKRRRCGENVNARSYSMPPAQVAGYFQPAGPTQEASSNTGRPCNAFEQTHSSPASAMEVQSTPPSWLGNKPAGLWGQSQQQMGCGNVGYQVGAGCSEISEQSMEASYSAMHTPQLSVPVREVQQGAENQLDTQRSNSVPDLRLLLTTPLNSGFPQSYAIQHRLPVMESSSTAGALVPFKPKAPEGRHLF